MQQIKFTTEELARIEVFSKMLNSEPNPAELKPTPDGKAKYLPISFVEMTLDELFFGQWSIENFKWSAIQNEVQGSLELIVVHPITGLLIRRTGAASIVITVDKVPEDIKNDNKAKNMHALNVENKKSNALDMAFPKLKAECLVNAAKSLGKIFGRDINRPLADNYQPKITGSNETMIKNITKKIANGEFDQAAKLLDVADLPEEHAQAFAQQISTNQIVTLIKSKIEANETELAFQMLAKSGLPADEMNYLNELIEMATI